MVLTNFRVSAGYAIVCHPCLRGSRPYKVSVLLGHCNIDIEDMP